VIQNARAFELEVEQRNLLASTAKISRRVSGILDPDRMLREVCDLLSKELGYDYVHVFLVHDQEGSLAYAAGSGRVGQEVKHQGLDLPIGKDSLVGWSAERCEPLRVDHVNHDLFHKAHPMLANVRSEVALPIVAHQRVLGILNVQSGRQAAFTVEDEQLLAIVTEQVAVGLENARHHAEVQEQARLDSLTEVLNHGAFLEAVYELTDRCLKEGIPLSLIMLDVDHFKEYNDRFGHVAGDAALRTTVQAIRAHVKRRDAVWRWGGEEFGIVLVGATKEQAVLVADRIRSTLRELTPVDKLGREMPSPTVSQGIAALGEDAEDPDILVDVADQALYLAKSSGRDQVRIVGGA
jgi:diguanylate cyclase (GGDEF)-like protein